MAMYNPRMIPAQGTLNCEQLENSESYDTVIRSLHNLDLIDLEKALFDKNRVHQIEILLQSISQVGLIGQCKWHISHGTWIENHVRWVFSDEHGRNVASSIYQILAEDISEHIKSIHGNHIKLICFGSVARGYSTFPISWMLPMPQTGSKLLRQSDIDIYLFSENLQDISSAVFIDVETRMDKLRSALPVEISFTVHKPNTIYSLEKFNTVYLEF